MTPQASCEGYCITLGAAFQCQVSGAEGFSASGRRQDGGRRQPTAVSTTSPRMTLYTTHSAPAAPATALASAISPAWSPGTSVVSCSRIAARRGSSVAGGAEPAAGDAADGAALTRRPVSGLHAPHQVQAHDAVADGGVDLPRERLVRLGGQARAHLTAERRLDGFLE